MRELDSLNLDADDLCELGIIPQRWLQDGRKVMVHRGSRQLTPEQSLEMKRELQRWTERAAKFQGTLK